MLGGICGVNSSGIYKRKHVFSRCMNATGVGESKPKNLMLNLKDK